MRSASVYDVSHFGRLWGKRRFKCHAEAIRSREHALFIRKTVHSETFNDDDDDDRLELSRHPRVILSQVLSLYAARDARVREPSQRLFLLTTLAWGWLWTEVEVPTTSHSTAWCGSSLGYRSCKVTSSISVGYHPN